MKNILFVLAFILLTSAQPLLETKVFICKGKSSKRYHLKKTCRGLSACKSGVVEVTFDKAKNIGRTLCKWED